jgi:hypothetical protein
MTTFVRPQPAPLPLGGLDLVVRAGRRRRAVFTSSGGAVVAVAVAVALLTGSSGGTQSLTPVASPPGVPSASGPVASGVAVPPVEGTVPPAVASALPSLASPPSGAPSATALPGVPGSPSSSPSHPPAYAAYPHHTAMRDGTAVQPPTAVTTNDMDLWYISPSVSDSTDTTELKFTMCNIAATKTTQTLDYRTTKEADFAVVDHAGHEVWRWSRDQRFAADVHTRSVMSGECVWWATDWYRVGDNRRLLPAGTYTIRMYSSANDWSDSVADYDYTIGS